MAVPVVAASTSNTITAATTLTLSKPSGVVAGDLLLLLCGSESAGANGFDLAPDGWTLVNYATFTGLASVSVGAFWRIADGGEDGTVDVVQASSTNGWGFYLRVTGAHQTTPIEAVGADFGALDHPYNVTGVTTSVADCLGFAVLGTTAFWNPYQFVSAGWTKQAQISAGSSSPCGGTWGTRSITSAGSSGTCSIELPSGIDDDDAAAFQFAVAPAPPEPPGLRDPRRLSRQAPFDPRTLLGRVVRRGGVAEDVFPLRGVGPRMVRQRPPPPEMLAGRVVRREGVAEDVIPPRGRGPRFVRQRPPPPELLAGRVRRHGPPSRLVWLDRELSLRFDFDVFAPVEYRLFARDVSTGLETFVGTAEPGSMTISGVALPDGDYRIRVEVSGRYWHGARCAREFPVRIVDGELDLPLPAIENLQATPREDVVDVSWALGVLEGFAVPEDFGVWIDTSLPVDVSGAPDHVVPAIGPGGYSLDVPESVSTFHVAVAARRGADLGPVATVTVEPEEIEPDAPSGASARIQDGDWA